MFLPFIYPSLLHFREASISPMELLVLPKLHTMLSTSFSFLFFFFLFFCHPLLYTYFCYVASLTMSLCIPTGLRENPSCKPYSQFLSFLSRIFCKYSKELSQGFHYHEALSSHMVFHFSTNLFLRRRFLPFGAKIFPFLKIFLLAPVHACGLFGREDSVLPFLLFPQGFKR